MRLLVTGGAGYVGSYLASRLLAAGFSVRVLDSLLHGGGGLRSMWSSGRFEFLRGDVREPARAREALQGIDAVIHLAAIVGVRACRSQPDLAVGTNLDGTYLLVEEAKRQGVSRFIFASTCSNYGVNERGAVATEETPLKPLSLYSRTKIEAEQFLLTQAAKELPICVLRLATVFGTSARMRFDLLLHEFVRDAVVRGEVRLFGASSWRPLVHLRGVLEAVTRVLEAPEKEIAGKVFNVGDNSQNYQKKHLADLIARRVSAVRVIERDDKQDPRSYRVSFDKIRHLGYRTRRTVPEGIEEIRDALRGGLFMDPDSAAYTNRLREAGTAVIEGRGTAAVPAVVRPAT